MAQTTTASNPWLGRKHNRVMLEKLSEIFMDAWADTDTYGSVAAKLDEELMDFFFSCTIDMVDPEEETLTIKFRVPASEHVDV